MDVRQNYDIYSLVGWPKQDTIYIGQAKLYAFISQLSKGLTGPFGFLTSWPK